ncbi:MAG: MerC domain-containing protein [Saprospiraceae bacterium]|nr:MerC domain-containing protein [Saprospiraceae bacterium]
MISKFFGLNLDFAGAATASICALHCAAFPVLLSLGIITGSTHNHIFDWTLMSIGILIAGYILIKDYLTAHKNMLPIAIAGIGFIVLFTGIETHGEHFYLNIIGGILIVASHYVNWKLSHSNKEIRRT